MKQVKIFAICFLVSFVTLSVVVPTVWGAGEVKLTLTEFEKYKKLFDDPRPYLKDIYKKLVSPELYSKVTFDVEKMKEMWVEAIGFKAPDEVGKIAPEIKPGTYSYKDKDKYPGLKALMIPLHYDFLFKPGGPPFAGCFPTIEVVPTRQYFLALPIAKATIENKGRTKLDDKGLVIEETYMAGFPFPKPEGKFKANQIIYDLLKRPISWDSSYQLSLTYGFTSNLKMDQVLVVNLSTLKTRGRVLMEPFGWYDERAKKMGEEGFNQMTYEAPRDMFGNVLSFVRYVDPDKFDQMMLYINSIRRVRLMSATDIQDALGGADTIYADIDLYSQKLSSTIFPYKCELIDDREYLIPFATLDGSEYLSSKGCEFHNFKWERRPMYVVKMTQLDKNFVYSYRILYIDKESFLPCVILNYDQKGRLYRSLSYTNGFLPEMGMFPYDIIGMYYDHVDMHSTYGYGLSIPKPGLTRNDVSLRSLVIRGK